MLRALSLLVQYLLLDCFLSAREIPVAILKISLNNVQVNQLQESSLNDQRLEAIRPEIENLGKEMVSHGLTQIHVNFYPRADILPRNAEFHHSDFKSEKVEDKTGISFSQQQVEGGGQSEIKLEGQLLQVLDAISGGQHEALTASLLSVIKKISQDLSIPLVPPDIDLPGNPEMENVTTPNPSNLPTSTTTTTQPSVIDNLHSHLTSLPVIGQIFVMRDSPLQEVKPVEHDGGLFNMNMLKLTFNFNFQYLPPLPHFQSPPIPSRQ